MVAAHKNDLNLETYSAIWLNSSSHTSEETSKLRISINHLKIFEDYNQCEDYIRSINRYYVLKKHVFFIDIYYLIFWQLKKGFNLFYLI